MSDVTDQLAVITSSRATSSGFGILAVRWTARCGAFSAGGKSELEALQALRLKIEIALMAEGICS